MVNKSVNIKNEIWRIRPDYRSHLNCFALSKVHIVLIEPVKELLYIGIIQGVKRI